MAEKNCGFKGCSEIIDTKVDGGLCIFHSGGYSGDRKNEYYQRINAKISRKDYNFKGFTFWEGLILKAGNRPDAEPLIFDGPVDFSFARFSGKTEAIDSEGNPVNTCFDASKVIFRENVSFFNANFDSQSSFQESQFEKDAIFVNAGFGHDTLFYGSHFKKNADFQGSEFSGIVDFSGSTFSGDIDFDKAKFKNIAYFENTNFEGNACFGTAKFMAYSSFIEASIGDTLSFVSTIVQDRIVFAEIKLKGRLSFLEVAFDPNSYFNFLIPKLEDSSIVTFENINFIPFKTLFQEVDITALETININRKPPIIFRYCQLKDVYFANNNMSLFSFYTSSFDEARFISSWWHSLNERVIFRYKRKNILPEELILSDMTRIIDPNDKERFAEDVKILSLKGFNYKEIASLYRRMKTALDRTKDYQEASWFYFNEFEMKRLNLKEKYKDRNILRRIFSRITLYNSYKVFAGYGEKPLWSFYWYLLFAIIFSVAHLASGLDTEGMASSPHEICISNYSSINNLCSLKFIGDFGNSFLYTLSLTIPRSFSSITPSGYNDTGAYGQMISSFNSMVMILFLALIIVGLKRHFRRF